jgi:hypothetical protein
MVPRSRPTGTEAHSQEKINLRDRILGDHPSPSHLFGQAFSSKDGETASKVQHRSLSEQDGVRKDVVAGIRQMLATHHVSPEAEKRSRKQREAIKRLGLETQQTRLKRFPANPTTRKGNLAEIVMAEYVVAANGISLPVYRLRYNPNVDQSMKGDDMLAFDLDADPVRVVVGEAKFRGVSSASAIKEIVDGLLRSHKAGLPVSLQFIADRLFEEGQNDLGGRVLECATLFAQDKLRLDYVGLLLSDRRSAERVDSSTPDSLRRLAIISLGIENPDSLVEACYQTLE